MWLRRWVGLALIVTFLGMNAIVLVGFFAPEKKKPISPLSQAITAMAPTVVIAATDPTISAGSAGGISWNTTGDPTHCQASGNWSGQKTPFGAESTGRINAAGNYTYTLTCDNALGSAQASAIVTVGNATPPPKSTSSTGTSQTALVTYCGGRIPCYGPKDVSSHGSMGNCWGYNGDRVIDLHGFDAGYHQTKSGISSIEVSAVCGKNLAPALSGNISVEGQTRNHNTTTKSNADKNEFPYFVGYFDSNKP
jgi:hypothetical protein